jgi:hypothetical protein
MSQGFGGNSEPPDTDAAVGLNQILEVVNTSVAIYNRVGGRSLSRETFNNFFTGRDPISGSPLIPAGWRPFDPLVTFDDTVNNGPGNPLGRFIVSTLFADRNPGTTQSVLDIAVSNNATPSDLSTDFTKKLQIVLTETSGRNTFWGDYPKVGWDADTVAFTANMFQVGAGFDHSRLITLDASVLFGPGNGWSGFISDVPGGAANATLVPAVMHDTAPGGPGGGRFFFVDTGPTRGANARANHIRLLQLQQPLSTNVQFIFFDIKVPDYANPIQIRQPGPALTNPALEIDDSILGAAYRGNRLVAAQNVAGNGGTLARWYDFNVFPTVSLRQVGTVGAPAGVDTSYPSIELAANGDLGMTFLASSNNNNPPPGMGGVSMWVGVQTFNGPIEYRLVSDGQNQVYNGTRLGDYSGIGVDPLNRDSFCAANEHVLTWIGAGGWATTITCFTRVQPPVIALVSSVNPSVWGQPVTFTATVSAVPPNNKTPTGVVTFFNEDENDVLGTVPLNGVPGNDQATLTVATLSVGRNDIIAVYGGDANFPTATSPVLTQTVNKANTSTAVVSSVNPSTVGELVTFTATISIIAPGNGTPTGSVQFVIDGSNFGNPVNVSTSGGVTTATINTAELAAGVHSVTAVYSGDGCFRSTHGILSGGQDVIDPGPMPPARRNSAIGLMLRRSGDDREIDFLEAFALYFFEGRRRT